jgi:hypothetical protein
MESVLIFPYSFSVLYGRLTCSIFVDSCRLPQRGQDVCVSLVPLLSMGANDVLIVSSFAFRSVQREGSSV